MSLIRASTILLVTWLYGCSPSPAPDEEIAAWFATNQEVFLELKSLGENHPVLHRIEPEMSEFVHQHGELDESDEQAIQRATKLLADLGADFVVYWRAGSSADGNLISINVPYYRWGLALGGYSQSISYVPDKATLAKLTSETRTYKQLKTNGWYIHAADTR